MVTEFHLPHPLSHFAATLFIISWTYRDIWSSNQVASQYLLHNIIVYLSRYPEVWFALHVKMLLMCHLIFLHSCGCWVFRLVQCLWVRQRALSVQNPVIHPGWNVRALHRKWGNLLTISWLLLRNEEKVCSLSWWQLVELSRGQLNELKNTLEKLRWSK